VNEEIQATWIDHDLYVAVYPNKDQAEQLDNNEPMVPAAPARLKRRIAVAAGRGRLDRVDWDEVEKAGRQRTGIPVRVTLPVAASASSAR